MYPEVPLEWHPTRNSGIGTPDDFIAGANRVVSWRCRKRGHVWQARINARTIYGQGCKKCAKIALVHERSMSAKRERVKRQLARSRFAIRPAG